MNNYYDDYYGYGNQVQQTQNSVTVLIVLLILIGVAVLVAFGCLAKSEARRQGRNTIAWFFLGFFFMLNAFIGLKVSKAADEEGHSMNLWSTLGVFFGVLAVIAFEAGLNAENKQHDFDCWVIMGFFFGVVAVFISCFLKPFEHKVRNIVKPATITTQSDWVCQNCGTKNSGEKLFCSRCARSKTKQ